MSDSTVVEDGVESCDVLDVSDFSVRPVYGFVLLKEYFLSVLRQIIDWPFWQNFALIPAKIPNTGSIFGFAEYIASLALLLVILMASDFRYRYRLSLTKRDLKEVGLWVGSTIGVLILAIDVWFQNGWPIPKLLANPNNLKAVLAVAFLGFLSRVIWVAVIRPLKFKNANAVKFLYANSYFILEGNADRLQVIAEELRQPIEEIVALASQVPAARDKPENVETRQECKIAQHLLLLIGDRRFCKIVVDKVPAFALDCFKEVQKYPNHKPPIFQFVRNIGQEFIRNTNSSFYQEESGYDSGLLGYTKPVTNIVFGSYEFVEKCADADQSPLDTDFVAEFNAKQMAGFSRASLAFLESYLKATKGLSHPHSYALVRMLYSFEHSLSSVYQINGMENDYHKTSAYGCLSVTVNFIRKAIGLVDAHAEKPSNLRISKINNHDIFDHLAQLIFETIFAASQVSSPVRTAWSIQYNTVWSPIFSLNDSKADKIIAFKVRRFLYDEIIHMNEFADFKGARILGYCLNVLGLTLTDQHTGHQNEFYPLKASVLRWTKANYKKLLADHPKVAEACLQGSVSYDANKHRLVKTYFGSLLGNEPKCEYLDLD